MSEKRDAHRRFLLGDLPDDEADALAARLLAGDDELETIEAAEAELIDAYLGKGLDAAEREQFTARTLGSERGRERVAFSRALHERAASARASHERATARAPRWRRSRAWYGVATLAVGAALMLLLPRLRRPGSELTLVVLPAHVRSAGTLPSLRLPPAVDVVRFRLVADNAPAVADGTAELRDAHDLVIGTWTLTRDAHETGFELRVPARLFTADGDYALRLIARDGAEVAFYPVAVIRQPR